jgi:UTP--glucose-1-phosphate uridylyltransferase
VILRHFADSGAPFLMECTRRTAADRKGGHLAVRKADGRLLLREVAQCPDPISMPSRTSTATSISTPTASGCVSICSRNNSPPTRRAAAADDPQQQNRRSARQKIHAVIQLEIAMGAAIECFEGSAAIDVPRSRFAPVKTTGDLLALRSDAYEVLENGQVRLHASREGKPPVISAFGRIQTRRFDRRPRHSQLDRCVPQSQRAGRFEPGVIIQGDVEVNNPNSTSNTISTSTPKPSPSPSARPFSNASGPSR